MKVLYCTLSDELMTEINELKLEAPRPKDSSLNISKAHSILDEKPQKINQSLDLFIDEIMTKSGTNF